MCLEVETYYQNIQLKKGGCPMYRFKNRSIITYVIINFFTLGIFGYYWLYSICKDVYESGVDDRFKPGRTLLLTIFTFGIYGIYWAYKMGDICKKIGEGNGVIVEDYSIFYLLLALIGLQIINMIMIQSTLNHFSIRE